MNREIRFRGLTINTKRWVYGYLAEIEKLIYGIREKLDNSPKAQTEEGISVDAGYIDKLKDIVRKNDNLINNYLSQISEML